MVKAVETPNFVHLEDDEVYPFKSAYEATAEQLRMAGRLVSESLPDMQGGVTPELLVGVLQAFATNFAALTISRRLSGED